MKTLYWHQTGPLMRHDGKMLHVENLNPQIETRWSMNRWQMFRLGLRCILASLRAPI
jgi:hypothetical protein